MSMEAVDTSAWLDDMLLDLQNNDTPEKADLRRWGIGSDGAKRLAGNLAQNQTLRELDLRYNEIGQCGARAIAASLKTNSRLISLDLSNNYTGSQGAEVVAEALLVNSTLTSLRLASNGIGTDSLMRIEQLLAGHVSLIGLDLQDNAVPTWDADEEAGGGCGAGIVFSKQDGSLYFQVARLYEGGPAARSGLISIGDVLCSVDGVSMAGVGEATLRMYTHRPAHTHVTFEFKSHWTAHSKLVTLTHEPLCAASSSSHSFMHSHPFFPVHAVPSHRRQSDDVPSHGSQSDVPRCLVAPASQAWMLYPSLMAAPHPATHMPIQQHIPAQLVAGGGFGFVMDATNDMPWGYTDAYADAAQDYHVPHVRLDSCQ